MRWDPEFLSIQARASGLDPLDLPWMKRKKVEMIGFKSSAVDFEKWPELIVDKLEAKFETIEKELSKVGCDPLWCLIDSSENDLGAVRGVLERGKPDLVMVGAGVRMDPDQFLLFKKVVNAIHEEVPQARIAFNRNPFDTVLAVERWLN